MTEWGVIGVIIALVGLGAVIIKPIVSLNNSITRLTALMDGLSDGLSDLTIKNSKAHDRIWQRSEQHENALRNHEGRIVRLEERDR